MSLLFIWLQRRRVMRQPDASSESTARRARASSERLVSWVELPSMVYGERPARSPAAAWNSFSETPKRDGSPPTSFSAIRRL